MTLIPGFLRLPGLSPKSKLNIDSKLINCSAAAIAHTHELIRLNYSTYIAASFSMYVDFIKNKNKAHIN